MNRRVFCPARAVPMALALIVALLTSACDRGDQETGNGKAAPTTPASRGIATVPAPARPIDPATAGSVKGAIVYDGPAPQPTELSLASGCDTENSGPVFKQDLIVGDGGAVKNAFVWVKSGLDGWEIPPAPARPVVLDQVGCIYKPHVQGMQVGQELRVLNSDPLTHNVHARSNNKSLFNRSMVAHAEPFVPRSKQFKKPTVMHRFKCDIHPWMNAYVGVVPHRFFAVTSDDGRFDIAGLPPGEYRIEVWHETLGRSERTVTIAAKSATEMNATLSAK